MHDSHRDDADRRLEQLFGEHMTLPADVGFSRQVTTLIERSTRRRSLAEDLAIPVAVAAGAAVAAAPLLGLVAGTGQALAPVFKHLVDPAWLADHGTLIAGLLIGSVSLLVTQVMED